MSVLFPTRYYGWNMVAAACAIQFLQAALLHSAFGAYFVVLTEEFGWSKTAVAGASALQPMESALLGPLLGWVIDRYGPQGMIRAGIVLFGLGFCLLSTIDTLAGFYGAIIVIATGASMSGYFPLTVAMVRWFERYRARAIAALSFGLACGGTAVPLVAASMQTFGWRATALGSGIIILVIGLPLAMMFRSRPEDIGEVVDGRNAPPPLANAVNHAPEREFTAAQALRTKAFWLISLGHGFALLVVYAVNVHAISHIKQVMGYTIAQASMFITLVTLAQVVGVVLGGYLGDRYEKRYLAAGCMIAHCIGLLLLAFGSSVFTLSAFAIIHGVAWGMRGPMMQALRADYFGSQAIGLILGISSMVIVLGQVGGPLITGILADHTGDYRLGFTVLAVLVGLGTLFFVWAKRPVLAST
jgi:sugar phosphate permease